MSTVFTLDDDPITFIVPSSASIPPGNITEADWLALLGRVTAVEGISLADLPDVNVPAPNDGDTLVYDAVAEEWVPQTAQTGFRVRGSDGIAVTENASDLTFRTGLTATQDAGRTYVEPVFGTTADTVAKGLHIHSNPIPVLQTFDATGYLSGSSRQLVSRSVMLENNVNYKVVVRFRPQMRGADAGAAYYTMSVSIGGNTRTSPGGATSGFWCVQGVPNKEEWVHVRSIDGTGASITITSSVAYHSGSGMNVDAGEIEIDLRPNR